MRKYIAIISLTVTLLAGFLLRAYRIDQNFYFSGELGKEMLYIREFAINGRLPLVGMATSHSWLSYGPIYYWIMIPIFIFISTSPFILFWVALVVALLGLYVNYEILKKITTQKIAFISTLIQALSPLLIWQTRLSKLHVFFWILIPFTIFAAHKLWMGNKKWLFWCGAIYGLLFSFHFSQIPIAGVFALLFYYKKSIYRIKDYIVFLAGVILVNITYIINDLNLALWVPYRVLNLENKNPQGTASSLIEYFGKNIFWDSRLWIIAFTIIAVMLIHFIYSSRKRIKTDFFVFFMTTFMSFTILANIIHGAPPIHYFLPIFTIMPILMAYYLEKIKKWPLLVFIVFVINLFSFSKDPLFYANIKTRVEGTDIVNYETIKSTAKHIVDDSQGTEVAIKRIGPYDYFPDNYSQNYKYLIVSYGGKINDKSNKIYTIVESGDTVNVQE